MTSPYAPPRRDRLEFREELIRKLIHLSTVVVPLLVWILPGSMALGMLSAGVAVAMVVEVARSRIRWARYHFLTRTRRLLRGDERRKLAGATYMAVAYLLAFILFPLPIAVLAMLYAALGDGTAALVGKRWGSHRVSWGKSFEGFLAGFLVDVLAGFAVPGISYPAAILGGSVAALLEFLPLPLDDNVRVTLGGGFALWAGTVFADTPL